MINKYYIWYEKICQRGANRKLEQGVYYEQHHIIPKSVCPSLSATSSNIVNLTAREHFICHWLLTKMLPNNKKLMYAFNMMTVDKTGNRYKPSSVVYAALKQSFSKINKTASLYTWCTDGTVNKRILKTDTIPQHFWPGRTFSEETRARISKKALGRSHSTETKRKMSADRKGRRGTQHSDETKLKLSKARSGSTASEETKRKMRDSKLGKSRTPHTEETKAKIRAARLKRIMSTKTCEGV